MDTFCFVTNFNLKQSKFLSNININKIKTTNVSIKKKQTLTTLNNICELDDQLLFAMISF